MFRGSFTCSHIKFFLIVVFITRVLSENVQDEADYQVVKKVIKQCSLTENKYSCLANKAAVAMEHVIPYDIPLFDGFTLTRNREAVNLTESRSLTDGITRLYNAASKFLDSHTLTLDLTQRGLVSGRDGDGGGGGGGGGGIGGGGKGDKKERKHLQYALMVLLGVFGISGPLIMNTLGIIAGKALIASKIALLIVGSVALKKIFDKDHSQSSVKVHTHTIQDHPEDDYDRRISSGAYKFLRTL